MVGRRSHKSSTEVDIKVKRLSEFLTCGRFRQNTSPLRVCVPASWLSWQFQGSWTAQRSSGQRAWHGQLSFYGDAKKGFLLRFRRQQVQQTPKGWRELSSVSEERGISTTFVGHGWLLCNFNCCAKTAKLCRKSTNNGGWTIHRRSAPAFRSHH